jgi:outer membrane protein assembly factor BamE (lipoprotein component of BamABCDE complex)
MIKWLICFLSVLAFCVCLEAKDVHVNGYTKKDGTYVAPYTRTSPNHTKSDNYSTKGNVNPYTGKEGTKKDDQASPANPSVHNATPWERLKPGMTKTEVLTLLGEPNIKSESKWLYSNQGTVVFSDKGLVQ